MGNGLNTSVHPRENQEIPMAKARTLKKTRKFGGKSYRKSGGTHRTKTNAKKAATSARKRGKSARVTKSKAGYSVYTRG